MKRIVRLTESDLTRIVRRVIREQAQTSPAVSVKGMNMGSYRTDNLGTVNVTALYHTFTSVNNGPKQKTITGKPVITGDIPPKYLNGVKSTEISYFCKSGLSEVSISGKIMQTIEFTPSEEIKNACKQLLQQKTK